MYPFRPFGLLLILLVSRAAMPVAIGQVNEDFKLLPTDGESGDRFGFCVAISGDRAVVGSWGDDDNGSGSGAAYVFDVTTGLQVAKLLPDDGAAGDRFGWFVDVSGDWAIVGSFRDDDNGSDSGSAYVFDLTSGQQVWKLLATDGTAGDKFGWSVSVSGDKAVVGAYADEPTGTRSGSAYVFDLTTGQQVVKLLPSDGAAEDVFGWDLAVSGDRVVVGAFGDDDSGDNSGSAYVFDVNTGQQIVKLLAADGAENDDFGYSVAISGETALVGAKWDDDKGTSSGSAYVFDVTTGQQAAKLLPADGTTGDEFGISVAISGDTALIGAWADDNGALDTGSAYSFDLSTGRETGKLLAADGAESDAFGDTLAICGSRAIVGSWLDDDSGDKSGSAYVFDQVGGCGMRYCGSDQNPDNASTIGVDTCDSASSSIEVSLGHGPANQFVYLLVGNGNGTVSQPPGAEGDLCVVGGSCLGRYDKDVGQISGAGEFTVDIANAASAPCAGGVTVAPGWTWNFQFWHRQPMGAPATFSEAISVTFQ